MKILFLTTKHKLGCIYDNMDKDGVTNIHSYHIIFREKQGIFLDNVEQALFALRNSKFVNPDNLILVEADISECQILKLMNASLFGHNELLKVSNLSEHII